MKKINLTVLISIFVCLLFSCSHGFLKDPRLYNTKKKTNNVIVVAPEPELQLTGGVDPFDDENVWYNDPNEGFPHTDFETLSLVGTWFNDDNVPEYAMQKEDVWVSKDTSKSEFIHAKAPDTTGQGYGISNVNWYQYRGKNPLYAADGSYNTTLQLTSNLKPKLSRFYFYRFTGDTLSPSLDNFLFAVDTYSKLMFACAYPTKTESVFGNNVPKAWGPTDGDAYKDGTVYQFYMYDPVGYVTKENGKYTVVMYKWFEENLAKGNYIPTLGEAGGDVAKKATNGAGKSPFNNHDVDNFLINMQLFAGRTFMYREKTSDGRNSLRKIIYVISEDGATLTKKTEVWNGIEDTPADVVYTIGTDEHSTATKGVISGGDGSLSGFEIKDEGKTIVFNNGITATTTFQDYGPDWLERVKHNPVYELKQDQKVINQYIFSNGGKTLKLVTEDGTYNYSFVEQYGDDVRNRAVYYTPDAWSSSFGHAGFWLYDNDYLIKVSKGSAGWAGTVDWNMDFEAPLKVDLKTTFIDNVRNKSFSFREKNADGFNVNLWTYSFDNNGKATLTCTPWQKVGTNSQHSVTNGTDERTGNIDGKQARLDTTKNKWTLSVDGKDYEMGYSDPGPSFLNRVKGATYRRGNTSYKFSSDGKTLEFSRDAILFLEAILWMQVEPGTYTYDQGSDKDNVIATYGGYRVHLYSNDSVVKIATVSGVGDASIMESAAERVN